MQDPTQLWVHATAWGRKCDNIFQQSAETKAYSGAREDFQLVLHNFQARAVDSLAYALRTQRHTLYDTKYIPIRNVLTGIWHIAA